MDLPHTPPPPSRGIFSAGRLRAAVPGRSRRWLLNFKRPSVSERGSGVRGLRLWFGYTFVQPIRTHIMADPPPDLVQQQQLTASDGQATQAATQAQISQSVTSSSNLTPSVYQHVAVYWPATFTFYTNPHLCCSSPDTRTFARSPLQSRPLALESTPHGSHSHISDPQHRGVISCATST